MGCTGSVQSQNENKTSNLVPKKNGGKPMPLSVPNVAEGLTTTVGIPGKTTQDDSLSPLQARLHD